MRGLRVLALMVTLVDLHGCSRGAHGPRDKVLARIGDTVITNRELQAEIDKLPPRQRQKYALRERRDELLRRMVDFEVTAREAIAQGYGRDPAVQSLSKQRMIDRYMIEKLGLGRRPENISDEQVRKLRGRHPVMIDEEALARLDDLGSAPAAAPKH